MDTLMLWNSRAGKGAWGYRREHIHTFLHWFRSLLEVYTQLPPN